MRPYPQAVCLVLILTGSTCRGAIPEPKTVQRPGSVGAVAFSPDGKLLAIGGAVPAKNGYARGEILVWDVASSQQRHVLAGHPGAVGALAFTPDGKILASGGQRQYALHLGEEPQNVKLWDVASGRELATMLGQGDQVTCIAFSPDGKTLASGGIDGTVKLRLAHRDWKVRATLKPPTRKTQDEFVLSLAFDPRGGWLAVGTGAGNVEMWDMATLKLRNKLHVHDVKNYGVLVALMPDGKTLATAAPNGLVQFWDAESLQIRRTLNASPKACPMAFSPDGKWLATVAVKAEDWRKPCPVLLWNVATGQRIAVLEGHKEAVVSLAFSPDGKLLASGSADATAKLWMLSEVSK
ncbi:MAG: WD40 repeat domain-containing protein [Thermoguttaceae bacterium]